MLRDAAQPFSIITRGPLIVRDAELLAEASRRADVSVTFSVPTLDDDVWRTTEPGTSPPRQRLRALAHARRRTASARPWAWRPSCPASRTARAARARRAAAREAGACGIWANLLYLRPGTREHFLDCLARDWPELLPEYERLYQGRAYLPARVAQPARDAGHGSSRASHGDPRPATRAAAAARGPEQLSLLSGA